MKAVKTFLLPYFILLFYTGAFSQQADSICITVTVQDSITGSPLDYASVKAGCKRVGAITSAQGKVILTVTHKDSLWVSRMGYIPKTVLLPLAQKEVTIGMSPVIKQLNEVTVSANKVSRTLDKLIFRPGENEFLKGTKVMDMISRVPGLSLKADNEILIKGRIRPDVYLEGKMVSPDILKNLPVEVIKQIEIIESPNVSYGSETTGGIINIVLKKDAKPLSGGSLSFSAGLARKQYMGNGNLMFSSKKIFAMVSSSAQVSAQKRDVETNRYLPAGERTLLQQSSLRSDVFHHNVNAQLFYKPDSTSQLSLILNTSVTGFDSHGAGLNQVEKNNRIKRNIASGTRYKYNNQHWSAVAEYKKQFNKYQELVFTGGYQLAPKQMNIDYAEQQLNGAARVRHRFMDTTATDLYSAQVVFTGSKSETARIEWEGGLAYHYEKSEDRYGQLIRQQVSEGNTNTFLYNKRAASAYLLANTSFFKKYQLSIGARLEDYKVNLLYQDTNEKMDQHFLNLLPSLSILRTLPSGLNLQFNYARKTTRPDAGLLSRFNYGSNRTLSNSGNSKLLPELTDKLSFSASRFSNGKYFDVTLYGESTSRPIMERTISSTPDSAITRSYQNFKRVATEGISFTFFIPVKENLTLNSTVFGETFQLSGKRRLAQKHSGFIWGVSANINLALKQKLNIASSLSYTSYEFEYQEFTRSYPLLSLSLQKGAFKNRFRFSLSWMDVIGTGFDQNKMYEDDRIKQVSREKGRNNNVILGVMYNFGKNVRNAHKQRDLIPDDVKKRKSV